MIIRYRLDLSNPRTTTLLRALNRVGSSAVPRAEYQPWRDDPIEDSSPDEVSRSGTGMLLPQHRMAFPMRVAG